MLERMTGGGFHIVIFDPNTLDMHDENKLELNFEELFHLQQAFVEYCLLKRNLQVDEIWLVGNEGSNPRGNNLQLTSRWLQSTLPKWREWPYSESQLRDMGHVRINLDKEKRRHLRKLLTEGAEVKNTSSATRARPPKTDDDSASIQSHQTAPATA